MNDDDPQTGPPLAAAEKVYLLRRVASYHALCQGVRKSSTWSLAFGAIMLAFWYAVVPEKMKFDWFGLVYLGLALAEFGTGLLNRIAPSAEGVLLDGLVLILFGGWNMLREGLLYLQVLPGRPSTLFLVFGGYWIYQGFQHVRSYFILRQLFAERPTRAQIRWYDGLLKEVRFADPAEDPQSLALPTRPPLTAKLLGDVAFFAVVAGEPIITTRDAVEIVSLPPREGEEGRMWARLTIEGHEFEPFPLSQANADNYRRWKTEV
jgi:hypothetical protein